MLTISSLILILPSDDSNVFSVFDLYLSDKSSINSFKILEFFILSNMIILYNISSFFIDSDSSFI